MQEKIYLFEWKEVKKNKHRVTIPENALSIKSFKLILKPISEELRGKAVTINLKLTVDYDIGHQATSLKALHLPPVDLGTLNEDLELFKADYYAQAPPDDFPHKGLL